MAGNRTLTEQEERNIAEAIELYRSGDYSIRELCNTYGIANTTMYYRLEKAGLYTPQKGVRKTIQKKSKKCPKCGNNKNLPKAKYCYNCGADIRDNITILISKLQDVMINTKFLPDDIRGEMCETIREAMSEFKKMQG